MKPLSEGDKLGPYQILSQIGKGGMGEVYKALDTRLGRHVALKVSDEHFSARFATEARAISAVNHPHVCTLYDIGPNYLVLELVEGKTLTEALCAGALPADQVRRYGVQIANALEAAHSKGVIHRDLKPGNIMLTKNGVKVLDFGLAKMTATADETLTAMHAVMGTPAYMAPEQAQGKPCDARTDIYAFGLVLYEMATGKRLVAGTPPVFGPLPPELSRTIKTCLVQDPGSRRESAHDLTLELLEIRETPPHVDAARVRTRALPYSATIIACIVAVALAVVHFREAPPVALLVRSFIPPPDNATFNFTGNESGPVALSADGRQMVFSAAATGGKNQIWVRSLESLMAQPLAGTESAVQPFWSPDGAYIGFFADHKLKKIHLADGHIDTLCDAPDGRGGTWNREGTIVFKPTTLLGPLYRISASGGTSTPATTLSPARGDNVHRYPWFLPDGRHFLYTSYMNNTQTQRSGSILVASLDSPESKVVVEESSNAAYSQGYLFFVRAYTLMAQPFSLTGLATTGNAIPLAENVQGPARKAYSVSGNGMLVYQSAPGGNGRVLAWFDGAGKRAEAGGAAGELSNVQLSPDGRKAAVDILDSASRNRDIWLYDLNLGLRSRFTFDPAEEAGAIWSQDGRTIAFSSNRNQHFDLYRKSSDGTGAEELLYADGEDKTPLSMSKGDRFLLYSGEKGLAVLPLMGKGKPYLLFTTATKVVTAQFSPDSRWIAYQSDESRQTEVYVAKFEDSATSGARAKHQVSTSGGFAPRWSRDGREILYQSLDRRLMAAELTTKGDELQVGATRSLQVPPLTEGGFYRYDVSADGRVLAFAPPAGNVAQPLTLVQNWTAGMTPK